MTREEKLFKINELKTKALQLKKNADYNNALQLALKLVLNGSYGAFAAAYFCLFNENVAATITHGGRELTQKMSEFNQHYWANLWHLDEELHKKLYIKNPKQIFEYEPSIYADTDSVFVGFDGCVKSCEWKNQTFKQEIFDKAKKKFAIIYHSEDQFFRKYPFTLNDNFVGFLPHKNDDGEELSKDYIKEYIQSRGIEVVFMDGIYLKNRTFWDLEKYVKVVPNFERELDFIHGVDKYRIADYFIKKLDEHAASYGVKNLQDFELERVSESVINIAKKKYIQHVSFEDGIYYDRMSYLYPKGVELIRSSTPLFARDKIMNVVKYLFENPDTFNIKELLKMVKQLRKEFELAPIDDISMQSSCSNYNDNVIDDVNGVETRSGAHFMVAASAHHNYLLHKNKDLQTKYDFIKSGTKVKYYYSDSELHPVFAYVRGSHPVELAPNVDYNLQFAKAILSPINSIIEPLKLPEISSRLTILNDIFGF